MNLSSKLGNGDGLRGADPIGPAPARAPKGSGGGTATREGIAVIGMSCLFPGAPDVDAYWNNILGKVDAVTDPPPEAWDPALYFDPDSRETDRVYSKRGGYLGALVSFDPLAHGIPPVSVGGEPDQWVALKLAYDAMADAGCLNLDEAVRRRTAVILGKGTYLNGGNSIAVQHGLIVSQTLEVLKTLHPEFGAEEVETVRRALKASLPPINPETVPGLIPNIIVGRIANRLDLMGPTYTVDAACASSLVAIQQAMRDLRTGECDLALVGGSQVWMPVPALSIFCQLGALSRRQQIRPFDKDADGTLLGEGIGMVVLKRVSDAERDGDRVYAVIRGVGVASDGRGLSVMAPRIEGEVLALNRAYDEAGITPATVGLIEAHGTGTPVGDITEVQALSRVFGPREGRMPHCALGSVKSMISHTIPAAGVAGLIKVALALHHKVLPPTLNCEEPNPKLGLEKTPFYVNTSVRPWVHGGDEPRRAGVNAFGFGGINSHAVVEEYRPSAAATQVRARARAAGASVPSDHRPRCDSEVCVLAADSPAELLGAVNRLGAFLDAAGDAPFDLADVAHSVTREYPLAGRGGVRLGVVATSLADLRKKLARSAERLADPGCRQIRDVAGLYYAREPLRRGGGMAFLVPGEGAQYPNMLADLCLHFPEVREHYDRCDRLFRGLSRDHTPSDFIFPRPSLPKGERDWAEAQLWKIEGAIESVRIANLALFDVLTRLAIVPDLIVGHSSGEYSALQTSGLLDSVSDEELSRVTRDLTRVHETAFARGIPRAALLALGAGREEAEAVAREAGVATYIGMDNCAHQVVLVCEADDAPAVLKVIKRRGLLCDTLPFDRPVHSPLFRAYSDELRGWVSGLKLGSPRIPLYSCTTTARFPESPDAIRDLLVEHWVRPVEFRRTVTRLHDEGVRLFVEAGPRGNLTAFVEDTLRGRPFCAVPANVQRRTGLTQLNHLVGVLAAHGVDVDPGYLFAHRTPRTLDLSAVPVPAAGPRLPAPIKLMTGFPPMTLPADLARQLRAPAPAAAAVSIAVEPAPWGVLPLPATAPPEAAAVPPGEPPAVPDGAMPALVHGFLSTMRQFLETQERVLSDCLGNGVTQDFPRTQSPGADASASYPLLGAVVSVEPGVELVALRRFDPADDLYLRDHALGRSISDDDPELTGLIVLPLTMSLELLAEAASCLCGGRGVVGLRDVRAFRWVAFADGPQTLQVEARAVPGEPERVTALIRNLSEEGQAEGVPRGPVVEATVLLADVYPEPGPGRLPPLVEARPSAVEPGRLYDDAMFHGPSWQGVAALDATGPGGAVARLTVLPTQHFFREGNHGGFVLDPVVLDAAGQVVGFWTMERLRRGRVIFPFRLDALDVFGPHRDTGETLTCAASVALEGEDRVRSDIEVTGADGRVWLRLLGWADKRFNLPERLYPLILPASRDDVSEGWPGAVAPLAGPDWVECRRVVLTPEADRSFRAQVWAHRVLSRAERSEYRGLEPPVVGRLAWLAGRTAAKEAVRALLRRRFGRDVRWADIEVRATGDGRVTVGGAWAEGLPELPAVSIDRTADAAVAVATLVPVLEAGDLPVAVGTALAPSPAPAEPPLRDDECEWFRDLAPEGRADWLERARCAKRAVAAALGLDRDAGARELEIVALDLTAGTLLVGWGGADMADGPLLVHTARDGHLLVATTLGQSAGDDPSADDLTQNQTLAHPGRA